MILALADWYYRQHLREWLFEMSKDDPELAHKWVMDRLKRLDKHRWLTSLLQRLHTVNSRYTRQHLFGLTFPNPIGLAAGFDKDGVALHALSTLGFGWMTMGAVLPFSQPGNTGQRQQRLIEEQGLLNRMGFNSEGAGAVQARLVAQRRPHVPLFINLGLNRSTSSEEAPHYFCLLLHALYAYVDGFEVNISSPNTPGLRDLQGAAQLRTLLSAILRDRDVLAKRHGREKPVFVKLAPDLLPGEYEECLDILVDNGVSGLSLTNTAVFIDADGVQWGKSGPSLYPRMLEMVKQAAEQTAGKLVIAACGGINSVDRAQEVLDAGASLVQIFTSLIFDGPGQARRLGRGLKCRPRRTGALSHCQYLWA